jgi:formylglycine-generating enzyme required for sulfatase activity
MTQLQKETLHSRPHRFVLLSALLALVVLSAAFSAAAHAVTITRFSPAVYDTNTVTMDAALGVTGYQIEDFEDATLDAIPGLTITDVDTGGTLDLSQPVSAAFPWDGDAAMSYEGMGAPVVTIAFDDVNSVGFGLSGYEFGTHLIRVHTALPSSFDIAAVLSPGTIGNARNTYIRVDRELGDPAIVGLSLLSPSHNEGLYLDHLAVQAVPEPSAFVLTSAALGCLAFVAWRRRGAMWRVGIAALAMTLVQAGPARAVTIPTVPVGNPGNAGDVQSQGTFGAVGYEYRIGTYEVTNSQYAEFLNAKAASDPLGLYNSSMDSDPRAGITRSGSSGNYTYAVKTNMGNKPVNYVSWYDGARFANWLHNGQGSGDTETGAYTLLGGTPVPSNGTSITRNAGATWVLASEDEWYKAAYYEPGLNSGEGGYWDYPTRSDGAPGIATADENGNIDNEISPFGFFYRISNYNFGADWNSLDGNVTSVGSAGFLSRSFYGTYEEGGNIKEWTEQLFGTDRVLRGGAWNSDSSELAASFRTYTNADNESNFIGFRVATVPEPSTLVLAGLGLAGVLLVVGGRLLPVCAVGGYFRWRLLNSAAVLLVTLACLLGTTHELCADIIQSSSNSGYAFVVERITGQSFTADASIEELSSIGFYYEDVNVFLPGALVTIDLFEGLGFAGTLVDSESLTIAPGSGYGFVDLDFSGNLLQPGNSYSFRLWGGPNVTGGYESTTLNAYAGGTLLDDQGNPLLGDLTFRILGNPVPERSALVLTAIGTLALAGLALARRRSAWALSLAATALVWMGSAAPAQAQTPVLPGPTDYGYTPPGFAPFVSLVPNAYNPAINARVLHPAAAIDTGAPTVFFAHGYPGAGIGSTSGYTSLLNNLVSRGYNVVFSPYQGDTAGFDEASIATRWTELTAGFETAVANFGLNTAEIGFVGHSFGGGMLPYAVRHEMLGVNSGNTWGGTSAFMYSMAPYYAYELPLDAPITQQITFPSHINVIEQVFYDDTRADPREAIDVFYNITVPNEQKDFLTLYSDPYGTPDQMATHFVPNDPVNVNALAIASSGFPIPVAMQQWGVLRPLDALADYTFTGNLTARDIALGNGSAAQIYMGTWSDGTPMTPLGSTDFPRPSLYPESPGLYNSYWSSPLNPRNIFPLVPEPSSLILAALGGVLLSVVLGTRNRRSPAATG